MATSKTAVTASLDFAFFQFLWHFYKSNRGTIRRQYKELTRKFLDFNNPDKNPKGWSWNKSVGMFVMWCQP